MLEIHAHVSNTEWAQQVLYTCVHMCKEKTLNWGVQETTQEELEEGGKVKVM